MCWNCDLPGWFGLGLNLLFRADFIKATPNTPSTESIVLFGFLQRPAKETTILQSSHRECGLLKAKIIAYNFSFFLFGTSYGCKDTGILRGPGRLDFCRMIKWKLSYSHGFSFGKHCILARWKGWGRDRGYLSTEVISLVVNTNSLKYELDSRL